MIQPYYQEEWITQYWGDALKVLPHLDNDSIDLLCTDPPYGIAFMGKDWDNPKMLGQLAQGKERRGGLAYGGSHSRGYKEVNIEKASTFFITAWRECLRVLKPGAFAFIMCSPRQDVLSRQIINLQEAGFDTGFTSIYWAYASGFPKAKDIGKFIDKRLYDDVPEGVAIKVAGQLGKQINPDPDGAQKEFARYKVRSPEAKALDGSYAGFQPKPSVEVIIVAMKPLSAKSYTDQALQNRKGITWLEDGRIPFEGQVPEYKDRKPNAIYGGGKGTNLECNPASPSGRFPANLLVSDNVLDDGRISKSTGRSTDRQSSGLFGKFGNFSEIDDEGQFSRYYDLDKWWAKTFPFLLVPKASKGEKDNLVDAPKTPMSEVFKDGGEDFGSIPLKGSPPPEYRNIHPTVKPIKLMTYLITIGSRAGDTVLDPFGGSGSTALAGKLINRGCIAIEINEKYCQIAVDRCRQGVLDLAL